MVGGVGIAFDAAKFMCITHRVRPDALVVVDR